MNKQSNRFSLEKRERAVRIVLVLTP